MSGTVIVLVIILASVLYFIKSMDKEKDTLIHSKFLSVRKNK
jgi:hypothetical protein